MPKRDEVVTGDAVTDVAPKREGPWPALVMALLVDGACEVPPRLNVPMLGLVAVLSLLPKGLLEAKGVALVPPAVEAGASKEKVGWALLLFPAIA